MVICQSKTNKSFSKLKNFTPKYLDLLKSQKTGPSLLKDISTFLDNPKKNQTLLEKILQSGNMEGFFDYIQVYGMMEYLFTKYPTHVLGVESIGDSFEKNPIMAIRIGIRPSKSKKFLNSIYSNHHYYDKKDNSVKGEDLKPPNLKHNAKSIMMFTGAHHSRELLTQNMICLLYTSPSPRD